VSGAAEPDAPWARLERAAYSAASAVAEWRRRATEAEAEVARLRRELERVSAPAAAAPGDELRRLRAENALLASRTDEARTRIRALLAKLAVLESRR
jgi:predicted nuclease with TOPRIM domain